MHAKTTLVTGHHTEFSTSTIKNYYIINIIRLHLRSCAGGVLDGDCDGALLHCGRVLRVGPEAEEHLQVYITHRYLYKFRHAP